MKILESILEFLIGCLKMAVVMGAIIVLTLIVSFFFMIFLPTQTQSAFQFFIELLFK